MPEGSDNIPLRDLNEEQTASSAPINRNWLQFIQEQSYRCKIISAIGIIALLILIVTLIIVCLIPSNVCHSDPCESIAKNLLQSINKSVNPCENFYDFVCKKRSDDSKLTKTYFSIFNRLTSLINNITDKSPKYLKKLKEYYKSCIYDNTNLDDIKIKLDEIGEWPLLNKGNSSNVTELHWTEIIHRMYKVGMSANYFVNIYFLTDFKNSSKKVIVMDQPSFGLKKRYLTEGLDHGKVDLYKISMINAIKALDRNDHIEDEINEVIKFEIQLANMSLSNIQRYYLRSTLYDNISMGDLESKYPSVKWLDYLNGILSPYTQIDASETVYVATRYFEKFHDLMTNQKPSNRVLVNYAFFRAANDFGVRNRIHPKPKHQESLFHFLESLRDVECTTQVNQDMYLATSSLYVRNEYSDEAVSAVKNISENVRSAYRRMMQNVVWLNNEMKNKILKKIAQMDIFIGYPRELLNDTKLEEYYQDLDMPVGNYIFDLLSYERFKLKKDVENFIIPHNKADWTRNYGKVVELEAHYWADNVIYISGGYIHPSLFNRRFPNYYNYAIIGEAVGHEISHSFDPDYRYYDEHGNHKEDWWDSESTKIYSNKTKCIVEKYNKYGYPNFGLYVNGSHTLDENMSDINGLKAAYDAYVETTKNKPEDLSLPGFENFSNKQMFWIVYGSTYCVNDESEDSTMDSISSDNHAPARFRIIGATSSSTDFAKDFGCKPTDFMNPPDKCSMWF